MSRAWPFYGRVAERERIVSLLRDGDSVGVVVVGGAGVGKSRLLTEVCREVPEFTVREVLTSAVATEIPLGAFAPLIPSSLAELDQPWLLLREAARAIVSSDDGTRVVVAIDDAHLLDSLSVALVSQLARARSAFLLMSVRDGTPVPETLARLWEERLLDLISLTPLDAEDVANVVRAALGGPVDKATLTRLWRTTNGNALYLRETLEAALESGTLSQVDGVWRWHGGSAVGSNLLELVRLRVQRLNPTAQQVVELLAFGGIVSVPDLERLVSPPAVRDVEENGLVIVRRSNHRIEARLSHPLYGEAVRQLTPVLRARQCLHDLADLIESSGARRRTDPLRIVIFRLDAHDAVPLNLLMRACRDAWVALDVPLLHRLALQAVQAGGGIAAAQMLSDALLYRGHAKEADDVLNNVGITPATEEERALFAMARAFTQFWGLDQPDSAVRVLADTQRTLADPALVHQLVFMRGTVLAFSGQTEEALVLYRLFQEDYPGQHSWTGPSLMTATFVHATKAEFAQAEESVVHGRATIHDHGPILGWVSDGLNFADYFRLSLSGQVRAALELGLRMHESLVEREDGGLFAEVGIAVHGQAARLCGRITDAVELLAEARQAQSGGATSVFSLIAAETAHAAALAGDRVRALDALTEARVMQRRWQTLFQPWTEIAYTWVTVLTGSVAAAVEHTIAFAAQAHRVGAVAFEVIALHDAVRLGAAARVVERFPQQGFLEAEHAVACVRDDGQALDDIARRFADRGSLLLAAEASAQAALAHVNAGRRASARASSAYAARLSAECQGVITPALRTLRAPQLTAREHEVAMLAVDRTNKEIASQLGIAERTVENHLQRVYGKLGVQRREDLGRLFG